MKFTHALHTNLGWIKTTEKPSDFEDVKHLDECAIDGDMFAVYDNHGQIHIFKGTMEDKLTLKTNTWYRHREGGFFVYRTGDKNNYGIDIYGDEDFCFSCLDINLWTKATDEEIEEALTKVAKKKGFKDIDKLRIKDPYGNFFEKGAFDFENNSFKLIYGNSLLLDGVLIFSKGKWARILEDELSIEERLKRIEEKLNI